MALVNFLQLTKVSQLQRLDIVGPEVTFHECIALREIMTELQDSLLGTTRRADSREV